MCPTRLAYHRSTVRCPLLLAWRSSPPRGSIRPYRSSRFTATASRITSLRTLRRRPVAQRHRDPYSVILRAEASEPKDRCRGDLPAASADLVRPTQPALAGSGGGEAQDLALLGPDDVHDRVDQGQVGEGLGEVPHVPAGPGTDLLGIQLEGARMGKQLLAQLPRPDDLAHLGEGGAQPERADREGPFLLGEAVVGLLHAVPE